MTIAVWDWYRLSLTRGSLCSASFAGMAVSPALNGLVADFHPALGSDFCASASR
eukprot:CAMPEP_0196162320 /NCGR_PEP_ID=MMETSP0910-20130528/47776_1 /TAXON_ID=49265 /ORGANISM="Thalassiosira rotula, Strain GSO102" /LENGTH=53 /DNA_ID=CAMNT_0041427267 /DNA_START=769 /DNA_END=926 /DNA_ORIENTATION=-